MRVTFDSAHARRILEVDRNLDRIEDIQGKLRLVRQELEEHREYTRHLSRRQREYEQELQRLGK